METEAVGRMKWPKKSYTKAQLQSLISINKQQENERSQKKMKRYEENQEVSDLYSVNIRRRKISIVKCY